MAIYAKREPDNVVIGHGIKDIDAQGRFLQADFGELSVVSLYMPSGTMGEHAQTRKYAFMDTFLPRLEAMRACGGFLPRERDWLTKVFEVHGFVDVFRVLDPNPDRFTWWVQWANARERNIGWRIDYQIGTPGIASLARKAEIHVNEVFSDHAPVVIDYDYKL